MGPRLFRGFPRNSVRTSDCSVFFSYIWCNLALICFFKTSQMPKRIFVLQGSNPLNESNWEIQNELTLRTSTLPPGKEFFSDLDTSLFWKITTLIFWLSFECLILKKLSTDLRLKDKLNGNFTGNLGLTCGRRICCYLGQSGHEILEKMSQQSTFGMISAVIRKQLGFF